MRFFIRDCNGQIVGNLKGYATHRGAQAQTANWRAPAAQAIADAFESREAAQIAAGILPTGKPLRYYSIKVA